MSQAVSSPAPAVPAVASWDRVRPGRRIADKMLTGTCILFTALGVFVLGWILLMLLFQGIKGLNLATFTAITPGPGTAGGGLANAIVGSLVLTFLGIGLQAPEISWGLQINVGQSRFSSAPYLVFFPALFLSFTVMSFMLMGDALRDALDPDRS